MRSHNAPATMENKSPINKLPVRLYNVQLIRFGSPVRRWTSLFFVFLATHTVCFSPRASVSVQWVDKSKSWQTVSHGTNLQVKKNSLFGSSHPAARSTVPRLVLFLFFIAFWFGASAGAAVVAASDSDGTGRGGRESWLEGSGAEESKSQEDESTGGLCATFDWMPRCFPETELRKDVGTNDH